MERCRCNRSPARRAAAAVSGRPDFLRCYRATSIRPFASRLADSTATRCPDGATTEQESLRLVAVARHVTLTLLRSIPELGLMIVHGTSRPAFDGGTSSSRRSTSRRRRSVPAALLPGRLERWADTVGVVGTLGVGTLAAGTLAAGTVAVGLVTFGFGGLNVGVGVVAGVAATVGAVGRRTPEAYALRNTNSLQPHPPPSVASSRSSKPRSRQNRKISSGRATSNG
jgi:hypothetical protein